ncbi:MAG TPA: 4-hydroxy-2-oxoheptanedioate aldolase [Bryobacteraceae bacterium]|nr:4-hydroxy-2-oxoheptanedioate aldolase [Bryobacteraceae bacterium]
MENPKNTLKAALARGEAQIGLWLSLANAYCAELCAGAGFDFVLIDGEHAPNDVPSVLAQLQAVAAYPVQPVVRAPIGDPVIIKRLLDIGAQSLLIPLVETAEQAEMLVRAMRYPPEGIRGVGAAVARASRWSRIPDYLNTAARELCLIVQVETQKGLEHIDSIAKVEGVDGVFIGPADLSSSLGHRGDPEHPEVQAAIESAIARIRAAGKAPGILWTEELRTRRYIELGCTFVAVGLDGLLLARSAEALAKKFKGAR